jgi:hypothetical protein
MAIIPSFGFVPPWKPTPPPTPSSRFSSVQVIEMAAGTVLAALIAYIAHTVTSLPAKITNIEQGQQRILDNQNRLENRVEAIWRENRDLDRRVTRVETRP